MHTDIASGRDGSTEFLPIVETDRLLIRPLQPRDLEACHQLYLDIDWADASLDEETNRERRRSWLDWTIAGYREFARLHQPQYGERAIVAKADGAFLGLIGMVPCLTPFGQLPGEGGMEGAPATPEVGLFWAVSPAAQGRGVATEAAKVFSASLFHRYAMRRLVATTDHDNARSIGVMRRIGMRLEANPFKEPHYLQVVGVLERPG